METTCSNCGKAVQKKPSRIRGRNYCSRECHYKSGTPRPARKMGQVKQCEVCGEDFYAPHARPDTRFCSRTCKGIASRITFRCETCGVESYGYRNRSKRWCSGECAARAREAGEHRECGQCGARFYADRSRITKGQGLFCSHRCASAWQGRNKTEHVCKICGKVFRWSPSRSASGQYNITYCSLPCRDADPERHVMLLEMIAAQQHLQMTSIERIGYAILTSLGLPFEQQAVFAGKFCVDAQLPEHRVVVQFDGDYWHDRKGTSTEPRIKRRVALDKSQDAYMRACGWTVIRLWGADLKQDPAGCAEKIRQHLRPPSSVRL